MLLTNGYSLFLKPIHDLLSIVVIFSGYIGCFVPIFLLMFSRSPEYIFQKGEGWI